MKDFAKIITASNGQQVLFYIGTNDEGEIVLNCIAELVSSGMQINQMISYTEDSMAQRALDRVDIAHADEIANMCAEFEEQLLAV